MTGKIMQIIRVLMIGVFLLNFVLAQNESGIKKATENASAVLFSSDSPICKILGILNAVGAVALTSGAIMAGYNFLSASQEAREKGKIGTEGLLLGAGVIALAPSIASYLLGVTVC